MKIYIYFFVSLFFVAACGKKDEYKDLNCSTINAKYNADITPIINANCLSSSCHGAGSANGDYTTYAGIKMKADNGSLSTRILYDKSMPPNGELSLDNRNKIKCWLDNGAQNN